MEAKRILSGKRASWHLLGLDEGSKGPTCIGNLMTGLGNDQAKVPL